MRTLYTIYRIFHSLSPRLANYIKKRIKGERDVWELTRSDVESNTYYPKHEKKPLKQIRAELEYLCSNGNGSWDNATTKSHYFQFGLDRKEADINNYIFQQKYDKIALMTHPVYAQMLRHKGYTATILRQAGIPVSYPIGILDRDGNILNMGKQVATLEDLFLQNPEKKFFCKPKDGFQSRDCHKIEYRDGYLINDNITDAQSAYQLLAHHSIEPYIEQHPVLNAMYDKAVNTIRVVTICRDGEISFYVTIIMIGSEGSLVSGIPLGGIVVGIDENGVLNTLGHKSKKPNFGKYESHPDTGVKFIGFQLPMWAAVLDLARNAHAVLSDIPSIGWDIAITPDGPIIVEANNSWGTAVSQYVSDNHKTVFNRFFELKD